MSWVLILKVPRAMLMFKKINKLQATHKEVFTVQLLLGVRIIFRKIYFGSLVSW